MDKNNIVQSENNHPDGLKFWKRRQISSFRSYPSDGNYSLIPRVLGTTITSSNPLG